MDVWRARHGQGRFRALGEYGLRRARVVACPPGGQSPRAGESRRGGLLLHAQADRLARAWYRNHTAELEGLGGAGRGEEDDRGPLHSGISEADESSRDPLTKYSWRP